MLPVGIICIVYGVINHCESNETTFENLRFVVKLFGRHLMMTVTIYVKINFFSNILNFIFFLLSNNFIYRTTEIVIYFTLQGSKSQNGDLLKFLKIYKATTC